MRTMHGHLGLEQRVSRLKSSAGLSRACISITVKRLEALLSMSTLGVIANASARVRGSGGALRA